MFKGHVTEIMSILLFFSHFFNYIVFMFVFVTFLTFKFWFYYFCIFLLKYLEDINWKELPFAKLEKPCLSQNSSSYLTPWCSFQNVYYIRLLCFYSRQHHSHSVHPNPFLLETWGEPPKFSKKGGGLDRTSIFRGELLGKRGWHFSEGDAVFTKNKLKSEIFNNKKSL